MSSGIYKDLFVAAAVTFSSFSLVPQHPFFLLFLNQIMSSLNEVVMDNNPSHAVTGAEDASVQSSAQLEIGTVLPPSDVPNVSTPSAIAPNSNKTKTATTSQTTGPSESSKKSHGESHHGHNGKHIKSCLKGSTLSSMTSVSGNKNCPVNGESQMGIIFSKLTAIEKTIQSIYQECKEQKKVVADIQQNCQLLLEQQDQDDDFIDDDDEDEDEEETASESEVSADSESESESVKRQHKRKWRQQQQQQANDERKQSNDSENASSQEEDDEISDRELEDEEAAVGNPST